MCMHWRPAAIHKVFAKKPRASPRFDRPRGRGLLPCPCVRNVVHTVCKLCPPGSRLPPLPTRQSRMCAPRRLLRRARRAFPHFPHPSKIEAASPRLAMLHSASTPQCAMRIGFPPPPVPSCQAEGHASPGKVKRVGDSRRARHRLPAVRQVGNTPAPRHASPPPPGPPTGTMDPPALPFFFRQRKRSRACLRAPTVGAPGSQPTAAHCRARQRLALKPCFAPPRPPPPPIPPAVLSFWGTPHRVYGGRSDRPSFGRLRPSLTALLTDMDARSACTAPRLVRHANEN